MTITIRLAALFALVAAFAGTLAPAGAQQTNGAGVVIRHGDGTLIYAYVQFQEESISGEELLLRTGLELTFSPFGGLGAGVCLIDGEGCPADDCYCESYSNPAYFWEYFHHNDSGWNPSSRGPSSREIRDGEIDGWSWTAGDHALPDVTIDEIALANGVDRSPVPTATPTATATIEPTPTATPTDPPPTSTATPEPSPTEEQAEPATSPEPSPSATSTTRPSPTPLGPPSPTLTAVATRQPSPTNTPLPTDTIRPTEETSTPSPGPTSRAAIISPDGSATPVSTAPDQSDNEGDSTGEFLVVAIVIGLAGGSAVLLRRRSARKS